jgi:hypothetical protein
VRITLANPSRSSRPDSPSLPLSRLRLCGNENRRLLKISFCGKCFRAYVDKFFCHRLSPGDIVIMDNLGRHKAAALLVSLAPPA